MKVIFVQNGDVIECKDVQNEPDRLLYILKVSYNYEYYWAFSEKNFNPPVEDINAKLQGGEVE